MRKVRGEEKKGTTPYCNRIMVQSLHTLTTEIQQKLGMSVFMFLHLIAFRSMPVMGEAQNGEPRY